MAAGKLLVYLLRRDLRVTDNPILHHLATASDHGFTHLLPLYVFPAHQIEVSGFVKDGEKSPYPPARSRVGGYWRCGPHRAKFLAQSVWELKENLEQLGSGLVIRVGDAKDVLSSLIQGLKDKAPTVGAVWMTEELSSEEKDEQEAIASVCSANDIDFRLWPDEKYFVDDQDTGLETHKELPDVFTSYRKSQEPLRDRPRSVLPRLEKSSLPSFPSETSVPAQHHPFSIPRKLDEVEQRLLQPLGDILADAPPYPDGAESAHPFRGGENQAQERLRHLVKSGAMTSYKDTRNGLLGLDFSTKLSAYLALGCVSARLVHAELLKLEDGTDAEYEKTPGYGEGECDGTAAVRFELLWRDYMRLCMAKFGRKLFRQSGFTPSDKYDKTWKTADKRDAKRNQTPSPDEIAKILERFEKGTTGMGLIDASQRELLHTGYTSNRARQNSASFLSKHLGIDWRYGAEWYEMMLVDFDVSSNWANWQYMAGVGNDPRGDARIFNPVKQAFDYDKDGSYVRTWVPELKDLEKPENVFQVWTTNGSELEQHGLTNNIMVTDPIKRIEFTVDKKPKGSRRSFPRRRGQGRGGRRGGNGQGSGSPGTAADAGADGSAVHQSGYHSSGGMGQARGRGAPRPPRGGYQPRAQYDAPQVFYNNGYAGPWSVDYNGARGQGNYGFFRGYAPIHGQRMQVPYRNGYAQPMYFPPPAMGPGAP
ncbi:putative cryptochrome DASH [Purpureocillium lavendulum]|uniref:Cryptochrome DASH n=1 Tax=Purpureocillium lavendulum TaxID=1247861 RepID=A0AB34FX98_9HYPO|nr:putative cryptochrome DASH [Purpureocillium lavendulum]